MTNENPGSQTEQNAEADAQAAAAASANAETEYTAHDAQEVASYAAAASPGQRRPSPGRLNLFLSVIR